MCRVRRERPTATVRFLTECPRGAPRRLERGTHVVAAVVESHGRKKLGELIKGIEVIPPHYISYRGTMFPELDIEAVLRRRPEVALVDEYAHSNIPGSANE